MEIRLHIHNVCIAVSFKIDLIVWKLAKEQKVFGAEAKFKIDLIVWKSDYKKLEKENEQCLK